MFDVANKAFFVDLSDVASFFQGVKWLVYELREYNEKLL